MSEVDYGAIAEYLLGSQKTVEDAADAFNITNESVCDAVSVMEVIECEECGTWVELYEVGNSGVCNCCYGGR